VSESFFCDYNNASFSIVTNGATISFERANPSLNITYPNSTYYITMELREIIQLTNNQQQITYNLRNLQFEVDCKINPPHEGDSITFSSTLPNNATLHLVLYLLEDSETIELIPYSLKTTSLGAIYVRTSLLNWNTHNSSNSRVEIGLFLSSSVGPFQIIPYYDASGFTKGLKLPTPINSIFFHFSKNLNVTNNITGKSTFSRPTYVSKINTYYPPTGTLQIRLPQFPSDSIVSITSLIDFDQPINYHSEEVQQRNIIVIIVVSLIAGVFCFTMIVMVIVLIRKNARDLFIPSETKLKLLNKLEEEENTIKLDEY